MKRLIGTICATAIIMFASIGGITTAFAAAYEEECDLVFFEAIEHILDDENIEIDRMEIKKEPVYDLNLNQLGYIYIMEILENEGYALIINTDGIFEVTEIYLDAENPYKNYGGQKIYTSVLFYLVYEDGQYIETSTGAVLSNEQLNLVAEKAFSATNNPLWLETETIYYTSRTPITYGMATRYPCNTPTAISNGCTPTAGANILHHYTRFFPNLIPNLLPEVIC